MLVLTEGQGLFQHFLWANSQSFPKSVSRDYRYLPLTNAAAGGRRSPQQSWVLGQAARSRDRALFP